MNRCGWYQNRNVKSAPCSVVYSCEVTTTLSISLGALVFICYSVCAHTFPAVLYVSIFININFNLIV